MAIPFLREHDPAYGQCVRVSPLVRRVTANNPGPFTFLGTGVYIVGSGEVAVIDPGPDDAAHIEAVLSAVQGERVTHILITHEHMDHCPAARPLAARTGTKIYANPARPKTSRIAVKLDDDHDESFRPDIGLKDGDVLSGPGWTLEAMFTPGHTSNHTCFALREENALFSGDHIMGWSTTVITPPDGDMTDYFASLQKVRERAFATLYPTHGPPIREVAPFIDAYKAHRLAREEQIMAQIRAGRGRIADMVPVMYADVDARLHPAAMHSVLAHMIRLVEAGVLKTDGAPDMQSDYRLA
jgi:glyoxylase-like metal-dependent hydrolase (beta-lactamase superfamily II)